jgi:acetyl esterase/lipase
MWSIGECTTFILAFRVLSTSRLAPEHPFPTGVNDCYDALLWAIANASTFKADPKSGLIVGGASAGGNLAAVLAMLSRDNTLNPPITGQYLCVPALLPDTNVPPQVAHLYESRRKNIHDPVLKGGLQPGGVEAMYQPETKSPLWDPYGHPDGHKGVARAFFQVGGLDPLRDEAVLYDRKLREAGVLTRFELYSGYGHMFWTNYPELEESTKFVQDTLKGMRWLLTQDS